MVVEVWWPYVISGALRNLISGRKQVMVHLVRDDPTYLKIPKGFFDSILIVRG